MIKNKSIIWHKEWVIGFFPTIKKAHEFIKIARRVNISKDRLRLFCPDKIQKPVIGGIKRERVHPEWLWVIKGSLTGILIGGLGGNILLSTERIVINLPMGISAGLIFGFAGAVMGGLLGLLSSGADSSLNNHYESMGKRQIMIAVRHLKGDEIGLRRIEHLFKEAYKTIPETPFLKKKRAL